MIVAIDPGIRSTGGTGIAVRLQGSSDIAAYLVQCPNYTIPYQCRASTMAQVVSGIVSQYQSDQTIVVIEQPTVMNSFTGRTSMDSEAIQKLYWYVGALVARIVLLNIQEVRLVTPNEWKGSVPKDVHHRRIRTRYNIPTGSTDVVDAVGMAIKDWHSCPLGITVWPDRGIVGAVTDMRSWIVTRKESQENATLGPKAPRG